jgi:hypothetical protein
MNEGTATNNSMAAHARHALEYQRDASREGRPVSLLLGGGALALVCMALMVLLAYQTWYLEQVPVSRAYFGVSLLFVIYVFGLFLFCYGYALYDTAKAFQMTLVLAVLSIIAVFAVIAVFALLAKLKGAASLEAAASGAEKTEPFARAMGSLALGGIEEEGRYRRRKDEPESELFVIHCQSCGERYIPLPPQAICPSCGRAALSGS